MHLTRLGLLGVTAVVGVIACGGTPGDYVRPVHPLGTAEEREALLIATAVDEAARVSERFLCLAVREGNQLFSPSAALVSALQRDSVVAIDDCPPIYARSLVPVDQNGDPVVPEPPPGHVDPVRLVVRDWDFPTETTASIVFVYGNVGGWYYYCVSTLSRVDASATCERRGGWTSQ